MGGHLYYQNKMKNIKGTYLVLSPPGSFLIQLNNPIIPHKGSFSATRIIFCFTEASSTFNAFCSIGIHENSLFDICITSGTMLCSKGYNIIYNIKLYFLS